MATLAELEALFSDGDLQKKVRAALAKSSQICIYGEDTTDPPWPTGSEIERDKLAAAVVQNPGTYAPRFQALLIMANSDLTVTEIKNATDTAIQNQVNSAFDAVAVALFGT